MSRWYNTVLCWPTNNLFRESRFLFVEERYYPLLPAKARRRRAILTNDFFAEVGIRLQFYHTAVAFEISSLCLETGNVGRHTRRLYSPWKKY